MKKHYVKEIFGVVLLILVFGMLFIYYYFPIKDKITETKLGKLLNLNGMIYSPIENNLNSLGISSLLSSRSKKYVNYASLYNHLDYAELEHELASLNISKKNDNEAASTVVVLNYHGTVGSNTTKTNTDYSISIDDFKNHMFALKQAGYETITMDQLYKFLRGEIQVPKKSFVLTFDDGVKESYYNTDPLLRVLNYTAVMFVITGQSLEKNQRYYLNTQELSDMQKNGRWEIESHSYKAHVRVPIDSNGTLGPFLSNKLWLSDKQRLETDEEYKDRIYSDLKTAKLQLEDTFNISVSGFALPFGEFGQRETNYPGSDKVILAVTNDLYKMVFYQFKPAINKDYRANYNDEKKDFYLVMRISADSISSSQLLLNQVESAQSLNLPYAERFTNPEKWVNVWGKIEPAPYSILIKKAASSGGAMAYLDGSYLWKDYRADFGIVNSNVSKIILAARLKDSQNYVGCKYTGNSVEIIKVINNEKTDSNEAKIMPSSALQNYIYNSPQLSIQVLDSHVSCYINGQLITQGDIESMPSYGGVGIRIEELNQPGASLAIVSLEVSENTPII